MVVEQDLLHYLISKFGRDRLYPELDPKHHSLKTFLVPLVALHPHEDVNSDHVKIVEEDLLLSGYVKYPIIVDVRTLTILDGHHRYNAFRRLGLRYIPAFLMDYTEDYVVVYPLRKDIPVSKASIVSVALRGVVYPSKTSRHVYIGMAPQPTYTSIDILKALSLGKPLLGRLHLPILRVEEKT